MNSNSAYFLIHTVGVQVTADEPKLINFIQEYWRGFEVKELANRDLVIQADIRYHAWPSLSLRMTSQLPRDAQGEFLSENLRYDENSKMVYFAHSEISGQISLSPTQINISADFRPNLFKHLANIIFYAKGGTTRRYFRIITRLLLQNPLFQVLRREPGLNIIPAAAVEVGGQAVVLCGLPGSGKSYLAKALASKTNNPKAILAQNYVLVGGGKLYPYPEGADSKMDPVPIGGIYFVSHGGPFLELDIEPLDAQTLIQVVADMTAEFPEHSFWGAREMLIKEGEVEIRETLEKAIAAVPCRRINVDDGATQAVDRILSHHVRK